MTTPAPDPAAITAAARAYPWREWHDELISDIALRVLTGAPFLEAVAAAYRWADRERRNERRGAVSLEELQEEYGDALHCAPLPSPALSRSMRGAHGERQPQTGIEELDESDIEHLASVIRNLADRNILGTDPLVCAIDVRGLNGIRRRAVELVLHGATALELRAAGISARTKEWAIDWLARYCGYRSDRAAV